MGHQRAQKHYDSAKYRRTSSFILRHILRSHPQEDMDNIKYGWEIISKEQTCLKRQVSEAILIKKSRDKEYSQRSLIIEEFLKNPVPLSKPEPEPESTP